MGLNDKIAQIARDQANQTFRTLSSNLATQNSAPPPFALVTVANGDGTYVVLMPSGQFQTVTAVGSNLISVGQAYRITGNVIF